MEKANREMANSFTAQWQKQWSEDKREIQEQMSQQSSRLARHDRAIEDQKRQIEQLQAQMAQVLGDITNMGGTVPQKKVLADDFDRETDKGIVRVRVSALAKLSDVQAVFDKHVVDAGLRTDMDKIDGADTDRNFIMRFNGQEKVAASRVGKTLAALRSQSGSWKQLSVETPGSATPVPLYLDEDKSRKTIQLERNVRKLKKAATQVLPGTDFVARCSDATLFQMPGWVPVAKLEAPAHNETILRFNGAAPEARAL